MSFGLPLWEEGLDYHRVTLENLHPPLPLQRLPRAWHGRIDTRAGINQPRRCVDIRSHQGEVSDLSGCETIRDGRGNDQGHEDISQQSYRGVAVTGEMYQRNQRSKRGQ